MASQVNLRGVYVAAVTPFGRDGAIAAEAAAELDDFVARRVAEGGVKTDF